MATVYSGASITMFIGGKPLEDVFDIKLNVDPVDAAAMEREQEVAFLTRALFNAKQREAAQQACDDLSLAPVVAAEAGLPPRKADDPYRQTADQVLLRMWQRAHEQTGFHVCTECKLRVPTGSETAVAAESNYGLHHVHGRGLCGPMFPEDVDPALAAVARACEREAGVLQRECAALTEDGYPASVEWHGPEDEDDDCDDDPADAPLFVGGPIGGPQPAELYRLARSAEDPAVYVVPGDAEVVGMTMTYTDQDGTQHTLRPPPLAAAAGKLADYLPSLDTLSGQVLDQAAAVFGVQRLPGKVGFYRGGQEPPETDEQLRERLGAWLQVKRKV